MSEEPQKATKVQLAFALAQGSSIRAWARAHQVPPRTAQRWSKDPKVRKTVEEFRRRTLDRAVGMMTSRSIQAVVRIDRLSKSAKSEFVQLSASRAIMSDMMKVSRYSGLETRMTEIEDQLREQPESFKSLPAR
jgi:hypothetical protein